MTDDEIEAKFMDLAVDRLGDDDARRVVEMCWNLEREGDVGAIVTLCGGPPR
jgi:hypothetical protein